MDLPTREQTLALLKEFNHEEKHIRHALSVEAVMRVMARERGENEEEWGVVGLIHDLDFEKYPNEHCRKAREILVERKWPGEAIRAVCSHGWGICSDEEPRTPMEKSLFAVDELTGLVAATALVRPSKSVLDMEVKSVKKKWKDKAFAAGVDRSVIQKGAEMLGMELTDLIQITIAGMREARMEIGQPDGSAVLRICRIRPDEGVQAQEIGGPLNMR